MRRFKSGRTVELKMTKNCAYNMPKKYHNQVVAKCFVLGVDVRKEIVLVEVPRTPETMAAARFAAAYGPLSQWISRARVARYLESPLALPY